MDLDSNIVSIDANYIWSIGFKYKNKNLAIKKTLSSLKVTNIGDHRKGGQPTNLEKLQQETLMKIDEGIQS